MHHDEGHDSVSRSECFPPQAVQTTDMIDVTFASVEEAIRILHGVAHYTPVLTNCQLDALAGALDAMDSVKQNRIVPMPNPNTLADGL